MRLTTYFFLISILLCVSCKKTAEVNDFTVLKGTVADKTEEKLYILSATKIGEVIDTVPIKNNSFLYSFHSKEIKAYNLVSAKQLDETGGFLPVTFFSERDTININFNIKNDKNNCKIDGGKLNSEYQQYVAHIEKPYVEEFYSVYDKYADFPEDSLYSEEGRVLLKKIHNTVSNDKEKYLELVRKQKEMISEGSFYSKLGKEQNLAIDSLMEEFKKKKEEFINTHNSLAGYFLFTESLVRKEQIANSVEKFNRFKTKFPNHSYTKLCENLITASNNIKVGGQYINFTAPDINNKPAALKSVLENNKVVLLDLWATWCGPCIIKTKKMIPIYDKYKDKGFTILGVAGEHKNLDAFKKFMDKEKWEWQQLIELDRQNKIWEKYNVMNSGGAIFLIDASGEILAVNPTPEEVEKILLEKL